MEMLTLEYAKRYTDSQRLAYAETDITTLFPLQELEFQPHPEAPGVYVHMLQAPILARKGQTIHVMWDGAEYVCKVDWDYQFGNSSIGSGGDDTGEPFMVVWDSEANMGLIATIEQNPVHTFRVFTKEKVVKKKIDYDFIPIKQIQLTDGYDLDNYSYNKVYTLSETDNKLVLEALYNSTAYNDFICVELIVPNTTDGIGKRLFLYPHNVEDFDGRADVWQSIPHFDNGEILVVYSLNIGDYATLQIQKFDLSSLMKV